MRNHLPWAVLLAATAFNSGCGTLRNPVPDAIPVRRLPDEVLHSAAACPAGCDTVVRVGKPGAVRQANGEGLIPDGHAPGATCAAGGCGAGAVFYTGGSLGSGEYPLTRELRVTEAIAVARGPLHPGMGLPSPSRITVLRRLSDGRQVPIRVDLNEALRDPRENIPVWPGDMILAHEAAGEKTCRVLGGLLLVVPKVAVRTLTGAALP